MISYWKGKAEELSYSKCCRVFLLQNPAKTSVPEKSLVHPDFWCCLNNLFHHFSQPTLGCISVYILSRGHHLWEERWEHTHIMVSVRFIESLMISMKSLAVKAMNKVNRRSRYSTLVIKLKLLKQTCRCLTKNWKVQHIIHIQHYI